MSAKMIAFYWFLIYLSVRALSSAPAISLPTIFYSYGQLASSTTIVQWATLTQCSQSTANYPLLQLTIIQPDNPQFYNNFAFTILEISACANSFASSCIIGTNYYKDGGQVQAYNNITVPYNGSISQLSFRYKAEYGTSPISLHLSYVADDGTNPIFSGSYNPTAFNTDNVPSTPPTYFGQYVKVNTVASVPNNNYAYYYLSFCDKDIVINSQKYYTVNVHVSNDISTPLAAFDLVVCSATEIPDYIDDCTLTNDGANGLVADEDPASVVSVTIDSSQDDLSGGIYVGIFGYGGELSGTNSFIMGVTEEPHS